MSTDQVRSGPPEAAVDEELMRFLEVHETRAHAIPGRRLLDLGDCVVLHDPSQSDPFYNRAAAIRWPHGEAAFDHRLAETIALFAGLDRRPNLWLAPGFSTPPDIAHRLAAHGFVDGGGGYLMLLVNPAAATQRQNRPATATVERLHRPVGPELDRAAAEVSLVLAEAFGVGEDEVHTAELRVAFRSASFHACLVRIAGVPVAVGKRYTFDGASYLSSIGTRPGWRGRGFGALVTQTLTRDSLAAGSQIAYLGVHSLNDGAQRLYSKLGYAIIGDRTADFMLG